MGTVLAFHKKVKHENRPYVHMPLVGDTFEQGYETFVNDKEDLYLRFLGVEHLMLEKRKATITGRKIE
jgi:hypothetical protein